MATVEPEPLKRKWAEAVRMLAGGGPEGCECKGREEVSDGGPGPLAEGPAGRRSRPDQGLRLRCPGSRPLTESD